MTEGIRASDTEREQATARLREHAAAGRLTIEELTTRLEAAVAARTRGELGALFADLPVDAQPRPSGRHRGGARTHTRIYVLVCLGMVAIWAATGMGYFWPVWPIFGWGIGVISHRSACHAKSRPSGAARLPASSPYSQ
jgi:hypothetical protein